MNSLVITSLVACGLLAIWLMALTVLMLQQKKFFSEFTKGVVKKDLKTALKNITTSLNEIDKDITTIQKDIISLEKSALSHFQKIGFVRFNPYSDTGSNQSFCLCLLDDYNSGIVITSLHSREQTRMYAKSIKKGKSESGQFSKEEKEAFNLAIK